MVPAITAPEAIPMPMSKPGSPSAAQPRQSPRTPPTMSRAAKHSPARRVGLVLGDAEQHHDLVADELLDRALVREDHLDHLAESIRRAAG